MSFLVAAGGYPDVFRDEAPSASGEVFLVSEGCQALLVSEKIERRAQKKGDLDAWQFRTGENEENCCLI